MISSLPESVERWLREFSETVRERDFARGRTLFDERVLSFGTVCVRTESLAELAARQWMSIWPNTQGFEFDYASARALAAGGQVVVMANWASTGFMSGGLPFARRGRATIILKEVDSFWKAVHTHFSLDPLNVDDSLLRQTA